MSLDQKQILSAAQPFGELMKLNLRLMLCAKAMTWKSTMLMLSRKKTQNTG